MACTENVLGTSGNNLVYLNKIFYSGEAASCPIIFDLDTCADTFEQRLVVGGSSNRCSCNRCSENCGCSCGCGCQNCSCSNCSGRSGSCNYSCCNFEVTPSTEFTVTNSCVVITSITPGNADSIKSSNVTIDGLPVTSLQYQNGKYLADLSGIMPDITRCPCEPVDLHICDNYCHDTNCNKVQNCTTNCGSNGHYFLTGVTGHWNAELQITLEGIVSNDGQNCNFKLCYKTKPEKTVSIPGSNNFAINCVDIPCKSNGVSPYLSFDFSGCAILLNPTIKASSSSANPLTLSANMVVTPSIKVQVLRPALFSLNATEVITCCDNVGQCSPCLESCNCANDDRDNGNDNNNDSDCNCGNQGRYTNQMTCQFCDTNGYSF